MEAGWRPSKADKKSRLRTYVNHVSSFLERFIFACACAPKEIRCCFCFDPASER